LIASLGAQQDRRAETVIFETADAVAWNIDFDAGEELSSPHCLGH
jgi:hypothetical protein